MNPSPDHTPAPCAHLQREQELLKNATVYPYKVTQDIELKVHMFYPEGFSPGDQRPAVVLFHGGVWDQQMVSQFVPQAMHLIAEGAIAAVAEYRVSGVSNSTPEDAIEDAQSLILWLRDNQKILCIDPNRISAWGAGSGAHIALCAAMNPTVLANQTYDSRPQNLVLFSAIVDTSKNGIGHERFRTKKDALDNSPFNHIKKKLPPTLFLHGASDASIPVAQVEKFCKKMKGKKNTCLFVPYTRGTHSFFNFNVNEQNFVATIDSAIAFLKELGFLDTDSNLVL